MKKPNYNNVHNAFKLNGYHYNFFELKEVAYDLVKEGEPYEQIIGEFLFDWLDNNPDIDVLTSGTTGVPKKIKIAKQHMVNSALTTGDFFKIYPGHTALHCLPANYIAGKIMLVRAIILGLSLDIVPPKGNPLSHTHKSYDFCAMVPLQVKKSLAQLERLKTLIIGGAPIPKELREELMNVKTRAFETYGMTETVTHIAVKEINAKSNNLFKTLPGTKINSNQEGCLTIDAPHVAHDTIVTTDLVDIIDEQTFKWLGRADNIINSGGVKLIPEQIEEKLNAIITDRYFVFSMPDASLGEQLCLLVEGLPSTIDNISEQLRNNKSLKKYEHPKRIFFTDKFEETPTGKVNRKMTLSQVKELH